MKENPFKVGDQVKFAADGQLYIVDAVTQTAGTPTERFYVIRLLGKYKWLWPFGSPSITHTLPEGYALQTLEHYSPLNNIKMQQKKLFDASSPGFLYSIITAFLAVFAASGLQVNPEQVAGDIVSSLSNGGVYAIIGILISSVVFPIWNFFKADGKITLKKVLGSVLFWVSLGNSIFALVALTGFTIPEGTIEQIVGFVMAKDWGALLTIIFANIINPLIRFIKQPKE